MDQTVFSPNIIVFKVQIDRIKNLWLSKLLCLPGLNDLSTFALTPSFRFSYPDAFGKSILTDSHWF